MNVRRYEATSMAEALAKVKGELGAGAVILHTRSYRRGGLMGWGSRQVVEITASADVNIQERRRKAAQAAARRNDDSGQYPAAGRNNSGGSKTGSSDGGQILRNTYGKAANRSTDSGAAMASQGTNFAATKAMATAVLKEPAFELRNELAGLRTMVESLLQRTSRMAGDRPDLPGELGKAYLALIEQQVADEVAMRVVEDVKSELAPEQLTNAGAVRERLVGKLAAMVPTNAPNTVARPNTGNGCRSICLVGPTGVGKTTTIAKLAAAFKLRQKQKVGLITIDTYRIAAVDQLRTYANIIGVPLKVVLTPTELVSALQEMRDYDTVLIDTAGRSPSDDLKLSELSGFVSAANPTEVHLVLSSTCTQPAMEAALNRFGAARVDQIIFTKLDEAVSFGVLLNVARKASKALSYITTGQDVPDHVEVGQPRRLAKLILGEKL